MRSSDTPSSVDSRLRCRFLLYTNRSISMPRLLKSIAVPASGKGGEAGQSAPGWLGRCRWGIRALMMAELVLKASSWPGASTSGPVLSTLVSTLLPSAFRLPICQPCRSMNLVLRFRSSTKRTARTRGLNSNSLMTTSPLDGRIRAARTWPTAARRWRCRRSRWPFAR